jgi:hypothetical protein
MTTYQPPVDLVDDGAPLPAPRTPKLPTVPAGELHVLQLAGYSLIAGVRDGAPFIAAPGSTREEALAALQSIVDALKADA